MTYIANDVNPQKNFFQVDLDSRLVSNDFAPQKPKSKKEVLPIGDPFVDSNLLYGGVERGRILNIEAFDKYAKKTIYYFACKIARTNKKIAIAVPYDPNKQFARDIIKYVTPNLEKEFQKNVKIYGLACGLHGVFDFFRNEKIKFDFVLIYDLWRKSDSMWKVKDAAFLTDKINSAVIVVSPLKAPSAVSEYRDRQYPAFSTILKYCQGNILIRPILKHEKIFTNDAEIRKVWDPAKNSGSYKLPSEMVFLQKDDDGNFYTEKQNFFFSRGYLGRPKTLLGFSFEKRMANLPPVEAQNKKVFYETDLFALASETC